MDRFEQVAPDLLDRVVEHESFLGATLGNPVLLAGFLAAAVPAALREDRPRWWLVAVFALLGSGFGVIGERSALLLPVVALGAAWWWCRPGGRRMAIAVLSNVSTGPVGGRTHRRIADAFRAVVQATPPPR